MRKTVSSASLLVTSNVTPSPSDEVIPTEPLTSSLSPGSVVPMPTFLFESTTSPVPPTVSREEKRFVEEAGVEKKLVEGAEVVVDLVMESKMWAPVQVGVKAWFTVRSPEERARPVPTNSSKTSPPKLKKEEM